MTLKSVSIINNTMEKLKVSKLELIRQEINKKLAEKARWCEQIKFEKELLKKSRVDVDNHYIAQQTLQEVAKTVQEYASKRISSLVTKCLAMVFPDPYTFEIEFTRKRGKTDARLLFIRRGHKLDPIDSSGGGVVDVAALALRLSCLSLQLPKQRKILILDEPLKMVSKEYSNRIRLMLEMLSEELGFQIIIATHNSRFQTGTVINLE